MSEIRFKAVGILGTGTIGTSWASFYAVHGMKVKLFDSYKQSLDKALPKTIDTINSLLKFNLVDKKSVENAKKNIRLAGSIAELVDGVDLVQESILEDYDVKKESFALMDQHSSSSTIIASSSSGLLMTELQKVMKHPQRALIAHPLNPPHLIPLVELVPGELTDSKTIESMRDFYESVGKIPVVLNREVPGYIANRLAAALWREAIDLVATGVASVEDVDKTLTAGLGTRWVFMGQHLIYHLGGGEGGYEYFINHIGKAFEQYWREMADWTKIPEDAKEAVISGVKDSVGDQSLSDLAQWRDEKLVKVLKAVYD